jgi:hypothetical protein
VLPGGDHLFLVGDTGQVMVTRTMADLVVGSRITFESAASKS